MALVTLRWSDGETRDMTVLSRGESELEVEVPEGPEAGEQFSFEKGPDGRWYEVNNSDVPVEVL